MNDTPAPPAAPAAPPDPNNPIRLVVNNAREEPVPAQYAEDGGGGGGGKKGPKREDGLPEGCPVVALGVAGRMHFYLDSNRQLQALAPRDHSRPGILALFGAHNDLLQQYWPKKNNEGAVVGWKTDSALQELMGACHRIGVSNALERVRGAGAWADDDGGLVLHCGDRILVRGQWLPPGPHGRYVYSAAPSGPRPVEQDVDADPAKALLTLLGTWQWKRGSLDARLLLGWLVAAMHGGALGWRPLVWVTGDAGTGKSTLHKVIDVVLGGAVVAASDTSAAGLFQKIGQATLPVAIDELEAEEDNKKAKAVIQLARQAASGGVVLRGGADHGHYQFQARSCFLFSSILIPPLLAQDRSRMAILELGRLDGTTPPPIEAGAMGRLGRALRRRFVMGWERWPRTLELWRQALAKCGHSSRGCDQFGTLLAAAEIALEDEEMPAGVREDIADELAAQALAETADIASDAMGCMHRLLSSMIDPFRSGGRRTVASWVRTALGIEAAPEEETPEAARSRARNANRALQMYGLKVVPERRMLLVANTGRGLDEIFFGSRWAGVSGAPGVWVQALRRLPEAEAGSGRIDGVKQRCTVVPLGDLVAATDIDD